MDQVTQIRAVIFDMDGVLTDSEPLINEAAVRLFREKGLAVQPSDFLPFIGTGEERYIGGVAEKYGFPLELSPAKQRLYQIYLELVPTRLEAFPGAVELVKTCRAGGLKVALASSADRVKIEANLRKIGLPSERWDAVVSAEDAAHKKPAPDIFLAAARKLECAPSECVVIEDAVNGVQAAKAAGMRCVAVAQSFPAEKLQLADLVKPRLADVSLADLKDQELRGHAPSPDPSVEEERSYGGSEGSARSRFPNPEAGCGVPPHPGPLPPGEGIQPSARREITQASFASLSRTIPPLPAGEGRGEGEQPTANRAANPQTDGTKAPAELSDSSSESGLEPPLIRSASLESEDVPPVLKPPTPWGFWATIGLSLAIAGTVILVEVALLYGWVFVAGIFGHSLEIHELATSGLMLAFGTCATTPLVVGLAWTFASLRRTLPAKEYLGLKTPGRRELFQWSIALILLTGLSDGLTSMLGRPIVPEFMTDAYRTAGFLPLLWLAVIVAAPVGEEIFFRGFLFAGVAHSNLGAQGAIFFTAGTWAAIHLQYDLYGMGMIFVAGIFLGYARWRTGSVCLTMAMHALMNLIATLQVEVLERFFRV